MVRLAGFVLMSFYTILLAFLSDLGVILVSFWCYFGVILVSLGCLFATWGLPGTPRGGKVEKVVEKVVLGSSPGTPFGSKSIKNCKEIVPRSTLERTVRRVLHKRCPGIPSKRENCGFVYTKPLFSHFHLKLRNKRKWCPMGTPLAPLGVPWASFQLFGRVLGTGWNFDGFWDPPWIPPWDNAPGGGGLNVSPWGFKSINQQMADPRIAI